MIHPPLSNGLTDESRAQLPSCWSSIHRDQIGLVIRAVFRSKYHFACPPDQRRWRQSQAAVAKAHATAYRWRLIARTRTIGVLATANLRKIGANAGFPDQGGNFPDRPI